MKNYTYYKLRKFSTLILISSFLLVSAWSYSQDTVSVTIKVSRNPVCERDSISFTATPTNGGTNPSYQWMLNGVSLVGATSNVYNYIPSNGQIITCILTSSALNVVNNPATSNTVSMTVNPVLPVSVIITASANNVCAGTSVTFVATSTNGGSVPSYQWNNHRVIIANATNSTYTYMPVNGDTITCVLNSNISPCAIGNPATSNAITIMVIPNLPVNVIITASANPACEGTPVIFTATPTNGGNNPSYQWKVNGANVGGGWSSTYTYTPLSHDIITCVLTSNASCPTGNPATSNAITISIIKCLPTNLKITPSESHVCPGTSVKFSVPSISDYYGGNPSYQWFESKDGGNVYNSLTNTPPYFKVTDSILTIEPVDISMSGYKYKCKAKNTEDSVTSDVATLYVDTLSSIRIIPESALTFCIGDSVKLYADYCSSYTYQWQKDFIDITGASNSTYTAKTEGYYIVSISQNSITVKSFPVFVTPVPCYDMYGTCYMDENGNCKYDSTEKVLPNLKVMLYKNNELYDIKYTNWNGNYYFNIKTADNYEVKVDSLLSNGFVLSCSGASVPTAAAIAEYDFGYKCIDNTIHPIRADLSGGWGLRPGGKATINLNFKNTSCPDIDINAEIKICSNNAVFTYTSQNGTFKQDSAKWYFSNVDNSKYYYNTAEVLVNQNAIQNDSVCFCAKLTPSNNPTEEGSTKIRKCFPIRNSWDPNDKEVSPLYRDDRSIFPDSTLYYKINFENTGNAEALNINVLDTLDNNLDITTLKLVSSSHPVNISTIHNGSLTVLKFSFIMINLTYKSANETLCNGFVIYSIKPKAGLEIETTIKNTAYIYFDFNPAIQTNTLENAISIYTGISHVSHNTSKVDVFPNPVSNELIITNFGAGLKNINIILYDMTGKTIKNLTSIPANNTIKINTSDLTPGVYILRIYGNYNTINQYNKIVKL